MKRMVQTDMDSLDGNGMESDCTVLMMDFHCPGYRGRARSVKMMLMDPRFMVSGVSDEIDSIEHVQIGSITNMNAESIIREPYYMSVLLT